MGAITCDEYRRTIEEGRITDENEEELARHTSECEPCAHWTDEDLRNDPLLKFMRANRDEILKDYGDPGTS